MAQTLSDTAIRIRMQLTLRIASRNLWLSSGCTRRICICWASLVQSKSAEYISLGGFQHPGAGRPCSVSSWMSISQLGSNLPEMNIYQICSTLNCCKLYPIRRNVAIQLQYGGSAADCGHQHWPTWWTFSVKWYRLSDDQLLNISWILLGVVDIQQACVKFSASQIWRANLNTIWMVFCEDLFGFLGSYIS